jgi:hypothetical protein
VPRVTPQITAGSGEPVKIVWMDHALGTGHAGYSDAPPTGSHEPPGKETRGTPTSPGLHPVIEHSVLDHGTGPHDTGFFQDPIYPSLALGVPFGLATAHQSVAAAALAERNESKLA